MNNYLMILYVINSIFYPCLDSEDEDSFDDPDDDSNPDSDEEEAEEDFDQEGFEGT